MGKVSNQITHSKLSDTRLQQVALNLEYWFDRGVNFQERLISLNGEVDTPWFDIVDCALTVMEAENARKTVTIRLYSHGGYVHEAMAVVGRIRKSPCHIVTEGYGAIMSATTLILACGDKCKLSKFATYMYHGPSYCVDGKMTDHQHYLKQVEREHKQWSKFMLEFTEYRDVRFWHDLGLNKDAYFTAEELEEMGVVDEVC